MLLLLLLLLLLKLLKSNTIAKDLNNPSIRLQQERHIRAQERSNLGAQPVHELLGSNRDDIPLLKEDIEPKEDDKVSCGPSLAEGAEDERYESPELHEDPRVEDAVAGRDHLGAPVPYLLILLCDRRVHQHSTDLEGRV